MDRKKQFETIALLRAYAQRIMDHPPNELRPSEADRLRQTICDMMNIQKQLDCAS